MQGRYDEHGAATALRRRGPSQPLRLLLKRGLVRGRVLDFGAGHGADVRHLRALGFNAVGWDPAHAPARGPLQREYDTILCTYVLNVLEHDEVRRALTAALELLRPGGRLLVTVRRDVPVDGIDGRGVVQRNVHLNALPIVENASYAIYEVTGP